MRRGFFVALAMVVIAGFVVPQKVEAQGFVCGVRGGANLSSLIGVDNTSPRVGYNVGLVGGYFFGENLGLTLEMGYSEQGTLCNPNEQGVAFEYRYNYLNVPLLLNYRLPISELDLRVVAGGQLGLFLNADYEYTAPSILGEGTIGGRGSFDKGSFHPMDVGVALGVQWFPWESVALDVRYTMAVTQTHDGISNTLNGYYYISVPDNRNSVVQLGLSVLF